MKNYYKITLGKGNEFAQTAYDDGFVGIGWLEDTDFSNILPDDWRVSNRELIPKFLAAYPGRSKVAAGLACGSIHTFVKTMKKGDIVLCPDGFGTFYVGEIVGDYEYKKGDILPHRRSVSWYAVTFSRSQVSEAFKNGLGTVNTLSSMTKYSAEIEAIISGSQAVTNTPEEEKVEDQQVYILEKYLEQILIENWSITELGQKYDIFTEEGETVGQQYAIDDGIGIIDILAVSKDKKELLVVELKRGRASYTVVGQIQYYMGYVRDELAESGQAVRGVIVALDDDLKLRRALSMVNNIDFYKYKVNFKLEKS